ncbi:hypothetical protein KJ762_07600 [bacterium]|nr:hypothetical protein [bacterium]MBU1634358.1 hypothetical protein [bacterium]MBU1900944.1 hypothetical protein [Patescibacteria group bacterium]
MSSAFFQFFRRFFQSFYVQGTSFWLISIFPILLFLLFAFSRWWLFLPALSTPLLFLPLFFLFFVGLKYYRFPANDRSAKPRAFYYWIFFAVFFLLAAYLRFKYLPQQRIGVDALYHLKGAEQILNGDPLTYARAFLYTYLLAFFQSIFGADISLAIVFNVVLNLITLFVFFLITKKWFNTTVAVIAVFLFSISPEMIWSSYMIRMYGLFQLFFLMTIFLADRLLTKNLNLESFISGIFIRKNKYIIILFLLFAGISYHLHLLTLTFVLPVVFLSFSIALYRLILAIQNGAILSYLRTDRYFFLMLLVVFTFGIYYFFQRGSLSTSLNFQFNPLPHHSRNYYSYLVEQFNPFLTTFFLAFAAAHSLALKKDRWTLLFVQFLVYGILFQFLFMIQRYFTPRYIYHILPLFHLLLAFGMYVFWQYSIYPIFCRFFSSGWYKHFFFGSFTLILLLIIPYHQFRVLSEWDGVGENPIYEISYPYDLLEEIVEIKPDDYLIEMNEGLWKEWQEQSEHIVNILPYQDGRALSDQDIALKLFEVLQKSEHGFYLTDIYRHKKWSCESDSSLPCFLRSFINEVFYSPDNYRVDNLMLFEWSIIQPYLPEKHDIPPKDSPYHQGFQDLFLIRMLSQKDFEVFDHSLKATVHLTPLSSNKNGGFLVLEPSMKNKQNQHFQLSGKVLYVPPGKDRTFSYFYPLWFVFDQPTSLEPATFSVDMFFYDLIDQKKYHLTKKGPLELY